jgi:hypothetical protein
VMEPAGYESVPQSVLADLIGDGVGAPA